MEQERLKFDKKKQQGWLSGKGWVTERERNPFSRTMINTYKERRELADYVPDTTLGALHIPSHLSLTPALKDMDYYPHLTNEGTEHHTVS